MESERFEVRRGSTVLAGEQCDGDGAPTVLLHAGVADRRAWRDIMPRLDGPVIAYDRRGFGESERSAEAFKHLDDLWAVLDATADGPAWLVGNSMGGALALDAALTAPDRIAGLVLISPAVSGEPDEDELDADTARLDALLEAASAAEDAGELNRLETWLWLDGPAGPEGRVGGAARELALAMNARILADAAPGDAGEAGLDAWSRLEEIDVPATVMWGDLDVPVVIEQCRTLAARLPDARTEILAGVAHLPSLEQPAALAELIRAGTRGR